ncbi:GAF domain-containing protein [Pedobacter polaris]|uniref:histidine kinase n=1 Tax=Pedobacter polaris TaxID=2571273 RepID=A0A4V5P225_9SPHI|nr:ATP-binding protein [Pedobacter polaris]TKC09882.1 GAF domain-containing protein [Pedobacter polaris]
MMMSGITLENCDTEPIHIPGTIQSHGFLITVDSTYKIAHCSENIEAFTGLKAADLLGKSIADITLTCSADYDLEAILRFANLSDGGGNPHVFQKEISGSNYNIIINRHKGFYLIDFEPSSSALQQNLQSSIGRSLSEILADKKLENLLSNAANQIKKIINYDRVMVYKFHEDGHGEVVAEAKIDSIETWMGLHYPASDIPKQARDLYKINLVRLIADVHTTPSPILTLAKDGKAEPLDLTFSNLRAVSPIHIQYLKNMGVASSFSVSVMDQDKLWGLIACHNYTPKFINFSERESAKLIGQVLSSAISFREQEEEQLYSNQHRQCIETITRHLLRNSTIEEALFNIDCSLNEVIDCTGAALYYDGKLQTSGIVPEESFIEKLIDWLDEKTYTDGYFMTTNLTLAYPKAAEYRKSASGLLACRLGKDLREYMLWFRPEVVSTIKWAGNPEKIISTDESGIARISPRNSFNEWSQQVELTAIPWKMYELSAVLSLRDEVNYSINRKATELRVVNEKLRQAYAELDTFSYTISHDLKNPLATIKSYAQLIQRGMPAEKISHVAGRIEVGANKMQQMIDEVLEYSKVGQSKVQGRPVNMAAILEELKNDLLVAANNPNLKIEIEQTPEIYGDELMIMQVFSNIAGNAVKYSAQNLNPKVNISGTATDDKVVYSISDNGIGIPKKEHGSIFELFSRASGSKDFEGTGVGLAIVKRILEKHNGEIWLDSIEGQGSVFFVSFGRLEKPNRPN